LQANELDVVPKARSQQSPDIFEYECFRFELSNCANCLRKHIPFVVVSIGFAADRKGLAGRAACHDINGPKTCEIDLPNISFDYVLGGPIYPEGSAGMSVALNECYGFEPSLFHAESQTPLRQKKALRTS